MFILYRKLGTKRLYLGYGDSYENAVLYALNDDKVKYLDDIQDITTLTNYIYTAINDFEFIQYDPKIILEGSYKFNLDDLQGLNELLESFINHQLFINHELFDIDIIGDDTEYTFYYNKGYFTYTITSNFNIIILELKEIKNEN